ncbi:MAG: hypothetical protein JSV33_16050 [bacterium]|nr:MAG: hypothetical protein JSV33_16050 [bacterium]
MGPRVVPSSILLEVTEALPKLLRAKARKEIAAEASEILERDSESNDRVRDLFDKTKKRLHYSWVMGLVMTTALFVLFVGMVIVAVISGLMNGSSMYPIIFGGVGAVSLFTVVIWKPYEKTFEATVTIQRLDMILAGLEEEWEACQGIEDPGERSRRIREANQAALNEMSKLAD